MQDIPERIAQIQGSQEENDVKVGSLMRPWRAAVNLSSVDLDQRFLHWGPPDVHRPHFLSAPASIANGQG